jgi:hypothetical protein
MGRPKSLFDEIVAAARAQRFTVKELNDGHVTFSSPEGVLFKTRRSGLDKKTGHGHALENLVTRLRRLGMTWPIPEPTTAMLPSLMHADAAPHHISPVPAGSDWKSIDVNTGLPVKEPALEETTVIAKPADFKIIPGHRGAVVSREDRLRLGQRIASLLGNTMAEADQLGKMAACSGTLIKMIRLDQIPGAGNLSVSLARSLDEALDAWERGERLVPEELVGLTSKQRAAYKFVKKHGIGTCNELAEGMVAAGLYDKVEAARSMIEALGHMGRLSRKEGPSVAGRAPAYVYDIPAKSRALHERLVRSTPVQEPIDIAVPAEPEAEPVDIKPVQPEPFHPVQPVASPTSSRPVGAAALAFAELFEQELEQRVATATRKFQDVETRLKAEIASLQGKNAELRSMVSDANRRAELSEEQLASITDRAMEAARQAIESALGRR